MAVRFDTYIPPFGSFGRGANLPDNTFLRYSMFIPSLSGMGNNPLFQAGQDYGYNRARDLQYIQDVAATQTDPNNPWVQMKNRILNVDDKNARAAQEIVAAQSVPRADQINYAPFGTPVGPSRAPTSATSRSDPYLQYGITQVFNNPNTMYTSGKHPGIDYGMPVGTPVMSPASGTVVRAELAPEYGNLVVIRDANGYLHYLSHFSQMGVKVGDQVTLNQVVGLSGGQKGAYGAGNSTGPHLHWEVRGPTGNVLDPTVWLQLYAGQ